MLLLDSINFANKLIEDLLNKKKNLIVTNVQGSLRNYASYQFNCGHLHGLTYAEELIRKLVAELSRPLEDKSVEPMDSTEKK